MIFGFFCVLLLLQHMLISFLLLSLEEERRLAYVAITRARKKIQISYVNQNRYSFASHDFNSPSRFISELPKEFIEVNDSKFIKENDFLNDFIDINTDVKDHYLTPGRKRLLENKKSKIDWDINQDSNYDNDISLNNNVFHKKYGNGVIINAESDTAEVKFQKFGVKKVYIKYLLPKI